MKKLLLLAVVGLLLVGCSLPSFGSVELVWDIHFPGVPTQTPTVTPTPEISPTYTLTPTIAPSATGTPTAPPTGTPTLDFGANLLNNPSFEGGCSAFGGIGEFQLVDGWTPWYTEPGQGSPSWELRRPEYKCAGEYPNRVKDGNNAQQWFTFYGTHDAGVYQQVSVTPGDALRFSAWIEVWSSAYDDPDVSEAPGQVAVGVGIDPEGGTDPHAPGVVWDAWTLFEAGTPNAWNGPKLPGQILGDYSPIYDVWNWFEVEAIATSGVVTVFIYSHPEYPSKHNDVYADAAALHRVGQGELPTPLPTSTPTPTPEAAQWVTPSVYLNLRDTPDGYILRVLAPGELCQLLDINGDWYKIKCGSTTGWAWGDYLDPAGISKKPSYMHGVYLR